MLVCGTAAALSWRSALFRCQASSLLDDQRCQLLTTQVGIVIREVGWQPHEPLRDPIASMTRILAIERTLLVSRNERRTAEMGPFLKWRHTGITEGHGW